jgi:hypothetical protein
VIGRSSVEHRVECDGKNCRLPCCLLLLAESIDSAFQESVDMKHGDTMYTVCQAPCSRGRYRQAQPVRKL